MSSLFKNAAITLAGLGAGAGLIVQQSQLRALRAELGSLQGAEASPGVVVTGADSSRSESALNDAERLELLRLRGEVAGLRKQRGPAKTALPAADAADRRLPPPEPASVGDRVQNQPALRERVEALRNAGLALRILAMDETPEVRGLKFTPGAPQPQPLLDAMGGGAGALDQIELLVPDMAAVRQAERYPEAIVARSREALPTDDGRFVRTYALGDGSVQSVFHTTAEETRNWGQSLDGDAVPWEQDAQADAGQPTAAGVHPQVFRIDPLLAKRYGLIVSEEGDPVQGGQPVSESAPRPAFLLDPVLAKRYGLMIPSPPKP